METKFRGQLCHTKEWIYGNLIIAKTGQTYIIPCEIIEPDGHHLQIDSDYAFWVIPETVGQFTGLKDKEGTEIYFGDKIYDSFDKVIRTIEWMKECAGFYVSNSQNEDIDNDAQELNEHNATNHYLVIGNKWEVK